MVISTPTSLPKVPSHFNFAVDVVDKWARHSPPLRAMLWLDGQGSPPLDLTYQYFSKRSHRAAQLLTDLGARRGDRMIILLPRLPAWWEIATAAIRAGIIVCPCTTLAVAKDIEYRAQASGASIFVGSDVTVKRFLQVRAACPKVNIILQAEGEAVEEVEQYKQGMEEIKEGLVFDSPHTKSSDPAIIYFTSGTTGMPKMVLHSQVSYPLAHVMTGKCWLMLEPGKLYWNLSEQGWAKAAWQALMAWFGAWNAGAALFVENTTGAFSASQLLDTLHQYPITTLCAPPTAYRQLVLSEQRAQYAAKPPKCLEHCVGAGEPLNGEVIRIWKSMSGIEIKDGYGQTETILICGNFGKNEVKPGSMGLPMPGVPLCIVDENGRESETGAEGDIAIASQTKSGEKVMCLFEGYLGKDGKTQLNLRNDIDKNGNPGRRQWYLTGDRAYRDEDGYIWFVGRSDDVINSSGYRIGPFEVESVLKQHPAVNESAVVASRDPERGEVVKAFVVLTNEYKKKDPDALVKEIQDFCKQEAAPYKYPRRIQFVEPSFLPKTISGKIRRIELREREKSAVKKARL